MSKPQTITQKLSWLHTWGGLIFGWLLFAIFLTGTLAVFDKEIDEWMRPEIPAHDVSQVDAAKRALAYLQARHPDASAWNIGLPTERSPGLSVSAGEQRRGGGEQLDPRSGERLDVRETAGGGFFFRFHFTLNLPRNIGIWVVGLAAVAMLVALVSGIVIHKKFFKEFFTFRPNKGQRSWLDAHNASGVLLLPFHLMITYTGLVIFYLIYMPAAVDALFDGNREAAFGRGGQGGEQRAPREGQGGERMGRNAEQGGAHEHGPVRGERPQAELTDLAPLLAEAERLMGPVGSLSIRNPGRADALIEVRPVLGNRIELTKGQSMQFHGVSGALLRAPNVARPVPLTQRVMAGLHFAQFGGYPMRWLYFVCGLVSSAMIATGLVLFTVKRRRRPDAEGALAARMHANAERVNIAAIAGLGIACVGMLWANRLLPVELADRAGWEVQVFFGLWLLTLLHACLRPCLQAWREQLGAAAALCLALPLLSLLTVEQPWADDTRLLLELTGLACGALMAWTTWRVGRPGEKPAPRRKAQPALEVN
ncbi:PepSY-associated TM helix domain-containing protein [Pseudomonas sp. Gutcm_11s]|uniref:PepSY-associated TM helix domain-containing protein n=1 Tax=Pseudomonas sp. Gutcm_11s TaxID=3026088 RepID=UPI0023613148|nr:PepSY-associated TM helix domain-containing protein [Pseudomonas sp. Gutcm_11s]MDD0842480.1 PepSY-associated TM helix domain-containing protein [Pseudomonas sp. Gutcm_11s]